jgi:hypothetical protein
MIRIPANESLVRNIEELPESPAGKIRRRELWDLPREQGDNHETQSYIQNTTHCPMPAEFDRMG